MKTQTAPNKFALGKIVGTPDALSLLAKLGIAPQELLFRHLNGDWSQMSAEDQQANREAVSGGGRIFSAYQINGHDFWVITEWDRSVTTLLLPENY